LSAGLVAGSLRHAPKVALSELHQSDKTVQDDAHGGSNGRLGVSHAQQELRITSGSAEEDSQSSDAEDMMSLALEIPKVIVESNKVDKMMEDVDELKNRPKRTDRTVRLLTMKIGVVKKMLNHMYHHFRGAVQRAELNREMHAKYDEDLFASSAKAVKTLGGSLKQMDAAQHDLDDQVDLLETLKHKVIKGVSIQEEGLTFTEW
jgi:hypothetical protein